MSQMTADYKERMKVEKERNRIVPQYYKWKKKTYI